MKKKNKELNYIDETINVLSEAIEKLKALRERAVTDLEEENKIEAWIKQTSEDIATIKKGVVG